MRRALLLGQRNLKMMTGVDLVKGGDFGLRAELLLRLIQVDPVDARAAAVLCRRLILVRRGRLEKLRLGPDFRFGLRETTEPLREDSPGSSDGIADKGEQL